MPKYIPDCPKKPEPAHAKKRGGEEREYQIELITPLFGGGVEAGENDPTMPIRGTAIRGQLQFWWRATRGAACDTLAALRERHRSVWGATEKASPVIVEVTDVQASEPVPCAVIAWNPQARGGQGGWRLTWREPFRQNEHLAYILFPFQGVLPRNVPQAQVEKHPAKCIHSAAFTLRLRFPAALTDEVEAAVWAWVNFGGLGARTRRGCGALWCRDLAPRSADQVRDWFASRLAALSPHGGVCRPWSVLPRSLLSRLEVGSPLDVWNRLSGIYKYFRQGGGFARNEGHQANRPGRSHYPEPDTIRRIMDTWSAQHEPQSWMPLGFPRAEFGLPIVFHFKDENQGDPPQTCLYPYVDAEKKDRMASPLILKPLALQNGSAVPVIVSLLAPQVSEVELWADAANGDCLTPNHSVPVRSSAFTDQTYHNSPFAELTAQGSALEAFLNFARRPSTEDGPVFVEITP